MGKRVSQTEQRDGHRQAAGKKPYLNILSWSLALGYKPYHSRSLVNRCHLEFSIMSS
ncbi:hypothetical protein POPTR_010G139766v4 [Populus trichocarpa]|uniref:Uncharacterized protein n=2 Tax=Populus trichocarpa TaxID=3694 RepID=A0ACC0SDD1_POPTR|nr:hypothetical protein POPTR_010G139766v4 [Populus trichocarpa]KAI9387231.1 hypothetical protein POPTR_010G139766v4 [Populus trichocarpa]